MMRRFRHRCRQKRNTRNLKCWTCRAGTTIEEGRIELLADAPVAPVKDLRYRLVRVNGEKKWLMDALRFSNEMALGVTHL